jgi:hypothetical protein
VIFFDKCWLNEVLLFLPLHSLRSFLHYFQYYLYNRYVVACSNRFSVTNKYTLFLNKVSHIHKYFIDFPNGFLYFFDILLSFSDQRRIIIRLLLDFLKSESVVLEKKINQNKADNIRLQFILSLFGRSKRMIFVRRAATVDVSLMKCLLCPTQFHQILDCLTWLFFEVEKLIALFGQKTMQFP